MSAMNYFNKITSSAAKAAQQVWTNVGNAVSELTLIPNAVPKKPEEELAICFQSLCETLEELAIRDDASSPEMEAILYDSASRVCLNRILKLLQAESDQWIKNYGSTPDPTMSEMPCMDTFLQTNVLQDLCRRAVEDKPRGTLPLILQFSFALMKTVKYPLLPHKCIYKPISQIISVASRYDDINSVGTLGGNLQRRQELAVYKKRIDVSLITLIGAVWRKISENPPVLMYFSVVDTRKHIADEVLSQFQPQMDVLTALITLINKPKVGPYAQEALVIALSMHDTRIDRFIVQHTLLVDSVVNMSCRTFQAALEIVVTEGIAAMSYCPAAVAEIAVDRHQRSSTTASTPVNNKQFTTSTHVAKTPGNSTAVAHLSGTQSRHVTTPRQAETKLSPLDNVLKSLRFCGTFLSAAAELDMIPCGGSEFAPGQQLPSKPSQSVRIQFMQLFWVNFLEKAVKPALMQSGEKQSEGSCALVRKILQHLSPNSRQSPLMIVIMDYLCGMTCQRPRVACLSNPSWTNDFKFPVFTDFAEIMVAKTGSVAKNVSTGAVQLMCAVLKHAPLSNACHFMTLLDKSAQSSSESGAINNLNLESSGLWSSISNWDNDYNSSPSSDTVDTQSKAVAVVTQKAVSLKLARLCGILSVMTLNKTVMQPNGTPVTGQGLEYDWALSQDEECRYTDAACQSMLSRLAEKFVSTAASTSTLAMFSTTSSDERDASAGPDNLLETSDTDPSSSPVSNLRELSNSIVLKLVHRKLESFSSQRVEEQLALTGLVEKCVSLLATMNLVQQQDDEEEEDFTNESDDHNSRLQDSSPTVASSARKLRTTRRDAAAQDSMARLDAIISIICAIDKLWSCLSDLLNKVPKVGSRIRAIKILMVQENNDDNLKKLVEKETQLSIRRLIETAIIVREMYVEIQCHIFALRKLRSGLEGNVSELCAQEQAHALWRAQQESLTDSLSTPGAGHSQRIFSPTPYKVCWSISPDLVQSDLTEAWGQDEYDNEDNNCNDMFAGGDKTLSSSSSSSISVTRDPQDSEDEEANKLIEKNLWGEIDAMEKSLESIMQC